MKARRFVAFGLLAIAAVASGALLAQTPQEVGTWAPIGAVEGALTNGATVTLPDGRTLITGGAAADGSPIAAIIAFNPVDRSTADAGSLAAPRSGHTATLLSDGRVLVVGGITDGGLLSTDIEIFDPTTSTSTIVSQLPEPRRGHTAALLHDGTVLIAGGVTTEGTMLRSAVQFDPGTSAVSPVAGQMQVARLNASATTLLDGRVLIVGGSNGSTDLKSAEVYERYSQAFTAAASQMSLPRQGHTATLLPNNGGVLIAGGTSNGQVQDSAELFLPAMFPDPFSYGEGAFASTGMMTVPRAGAVAGAMSVDGFAFAAGGGSSDAEVYRFATIKTDKDDYAPGELALITGSGWQSSEEVTLLFQEDPAVHEDYVLKVTADGAGNFTWNKWAPEPHDLGVRFYLTGIGSKSRAQITFTDATATTTTVSTSPNPSTPSANVTATATVTVGTTPVTQGLVKFYVGGNNCSGNLGTLFGPAAGVALNGSGQASASTALLTNGVTVRACYQGFGSGSDSLQSSMGEVIQTVTTNVATNTVVSSSANASTYGGSVTFSAVVSRTTGSGTPTGSVQFKIDNVNFGGPVSLGAPSTATSATATSGAINSLIAGTHVIDAVYVPTGSFVTSSDTLDGGQVVNKADAVCTITGFSGTFDANPHGATGSCGGVAIDPTAAGSSLSLGATFTSVPGGTANWSFTGGTNYNNQSGSVAITISKAAAVCAISGYAGSYDAAPHGATGSCVGVAADPTAAGSSLSLGSTFVNVPGGAANWSFTGGTNYNNQSGSVAITISKTAAVCNVNGYSGTYDAAAHGATGSCTGVDNGSAAGSSLNLGESFTNAPGGSAHWVFTGGGNYNDQSGDAAIVINKANALCTINGFTGTYDAASHGATGSCSGVDNGLAAGSSLALGASFTNVPGGTAHWSFTGGTNYNDQSGDAAIVIDKATAACTIDGYTGTYDAAAHGATGSCSGVDSNGAATGGSLDLGASFTNAPGGTAHWVFTGGTNYNDKSGDAAIVIDKATAVCSIDGYTGTYDAAAHGATGSCTGVDSGSAAGGSLTLGASFTNAPGGTAHWVFTGGTNYTNQEGDVAIVINKATATVNVTGYTGTFDGNAHGATGTATGVGAATLSGLNLGATFTNVPGGTAHWTFDGGTNYTNQEGDVAIVINRANASVTVNGYTGVYDGAAHGATGSASGIGGVDLSPSLNLGATFTNAPGGTAHWTFDGGINYNDQSGDVAIVITKADALVSVNGYTGTFDGNAHGATGSATGVGGANLSASLNFGATFTNVPGGTAHWTFAGGNNYNDQAGDVAIVISKANASVSVSGYSGAYDGAAHGATGSATGVGGVDLTTSLNLGATFTDVPGGTAHWTFADQSGNYNDAGGDVAITITKINATVIVTGYTGTFDGNAHGASGNATGAGNTNLSASLALGDTFTNVPGGTAHWTFTGGTNYYNQSGEVAIVITKADAVVTVNGYTGSFDGNAHGATGTAIGAGGANLAASLNLGADFTNVPGGTAHWTFTGGTNYNDQSGDVAIVINKANANVSVNGYTGTFDGNAHGATGTATGVAGANLNAGLNLGGTFTNYPGGTAHWVFTDQTGNYNNASGDVAIVINKANAVVNVSGYTGTFDGNAHGATGTATGVAGANLSAGLNLGATFTDYPGGTAHWVFTDQTGNYNDASGDVAIVINKANAIVNVSGYTGIFDGNAHGATGTATGIGGTSLGAGLNLGATFTNPPGGTAHWTFAGGTNYNDQSGDVAIVINRWTTDGFYQPIDMSGAQVVWNTVKGGSTVPLKFNLFAGAEKKTNVADVKSFAAAETPCIASSSEAAVEFTTTGGTQLRYDGTAGQFIQNWQTPKTAGKCYVVRMTAQDGSTIDAWFKMK